MSLIDWSEDHILKIGNEVEYNISEEHTKAQREKIEPWLTAVFQSEHLSLLIGNGLPVAVTQIAEIEQQTMDRIEFSEFKDQIKSNAESQAKNLGRGTANFEDDLRVAFELYSGLLIHDPVAAGKLKDEIDHKMLTYLKTILISEREFLQSPKMQEALIYLKNFLFSFASRTASRDRLNVFTTNYDRFVEYACDMAGLLILDRFIGKIEPIFRTNKLELDYHYNPPGIRGEPRYVEGVLRYTKIHGSLDWRFRETQIFKALLPFGASDNHDVLPKEPSTHVVIYPNSSKGIETVFYPYSELFRDFSSAVSQPNSVLVTYGYGFGDSHINRILEDMLSIPSTHIAVISYSKADGRIEEFVEKINSAQVTLLIGDHLGNLKTLVEHYLPKAAIDRISEREHKYREKTGRMLIGDDESTSQIWEE